MTDRQQNIIALAEWMGWKWSMHNVHYKTGVWKNPNGLEYPTWTTKAEIPFNPYESADDCEAVIRKLGELGVGVDIYRRPWMDAESVTVYMQGEPIDWKEMRWSGDDWKEGVCELALKVKEAVAE